VNGETLVRDVLREMTGEELESLDAPLRSLGLDSLDVVQLVLDVEGKIGTEIDTTKLYGLTTFREVVALVQEVLNAAGSSRL
jgi:acyl carrier protein